MIVNTVSQYGIETTQSFYNNGRTDPPTYRTIRSETHGGSATGIIKGNHKNANPFSFNISTNKSLSGNVRLQQPWGHTLVSGTLASSSGITQTSQAQARASARVYAMCIDDFYSQLEGVADIASSVGEGGIKRSAQQVVQSADDVRRQAGTYGLKTVGKAWLHAQYVWKPLVSDIYHVTQAITGTMTRKGFRVDARAQTTESFGVNENIGAAGYTFSCPLQGQVTSRCRMVGTFKVNPWADLLAQLTSLDPAVIAWNMLPYSFVVDWFYNIGGYLGQLEAASRYKSAFVSKGGFQTYTELVDAHVNHYGSARGYPNVTAHLQSSFRRKTLTRTVLNGIPLPHAPSLKCDLGSGTLLNAAALLASKLRF